MESQEPPEHPPAAPLARRERGHLITAEDRAAAQRERYQRQRDVIRDTGTIPGTQITLYESMAPQPGIVLIKEHKINAGQTKASKNPHQNIEKTGGAGTEEKPATEFFAMEGSGFILRAMSPQTEFSVAGRDLGTQVKLTKLFEMIGRNQKAWLSPKVPAGDPYRSPFPGFVAWIHEHCLAWLVVEGTKIGLKFTVSDETKNQAESQVETVKRTIVYALKHPFRSPCPVIDRRPGLQLADKILGISNAAIQTARGGTRFENKGATLGAERLFEFYRLALSEASDQQEKRDIHEAYHRILLHKFLQRLRLTPPPLGSRSRAADPLGDSIERRALLLQAHRVFVFAPNGCPVALNTQLLEQNGIGIKELKIHSATIPAKATEWANWLYDEVLDLDKRNCIQTEAMVAARAMEARRQAETERAYYEESDEGFDTTTGRYITRAEIDLPQITRAGRPETSQEQQAREAAETIARMRLIQKGPAAKKVPREEVERRLAARAEIMRAQKAARAKAAEEAAAIEAESKKPLGFFQGVVALALAGYLR